MIDRVRFVKPWRTYSIGDVIRGPWFFVSPQMLIARGIAEEIEDVVVHVETATVAPTECAATRTAPPKPRRKRGRPRKYPLPVAKEPDADGASPIDTADD